MSNDSFSNNYELFTLLDIRKYTESIKGLESIRTMSNKELQLLNTWIKDYKNTMLNDLENLKNNITNEELETLLQFDNTNTKYSLTFLEQITGFAVDLYHGKNSKKQQIDINFIADYILIDAVLSIDKLEYEVVTDKAIEKLKDFAKEVFKDHKYRLIIETYLSMCIEIITKNLYRVFKNNNLNFLVKKYANTKFDVNKQSNEDKVYQELMSELKIFDDDFIKNAYKYNDLENIIREVIKDIFKINSLQDYAFLPNSTVTKFIKNLSISQSNTKANKIPVNKNVEVYMDSNPETGQTKFDYIADRESYNIIFEDLNSLKSRQSLPFRKTLNFILIKANEQNITKNIQDTTQSIYFHLNEYKENTGYKSKDTAYRAAIKNFDILMGITVGGNLKKGKKEIRNAASYIFTARDITYNQCFIECKPKVMQMLMQYFTILPTWAGELNTKAYDLLDYIFYMARQTQSICNIRKNNTFNIKFNSINEYIGGYDPANTKRHTEYIVDPILNAIEEIEQTQRGEKLFITPIYNHDYKNVYEFLNNGYIEVELGKEATEYFCNRSIEREKSIKKTIEKATKK